MLLTKEQISEQTCKHAQKKNGLHDLMEIMLESMMIADLPHSYILADGIEHPIGKKLPLWIVGLLY